MPVPVTVWAVELTPDAPLEEVKGSLSLDADALVFTPRDGAKPARRIPLGTVVKVRRLRGSPVLMIVRGEGGVQARTAFYFVQPPPLDRPSARAAFGGVQRNTKRKARRQNVSYFGIWNQEKKTILQEWERALRGALGSPGG